MKTMGALLNIEGSIQNRKYKPETSDHANIASVANNPFDVSSLITFSPIPFLNRFLCYLVSRITGISLGKESKRP